MSLAESRKAALDNSRIIREGRDPLAERSQAIEARQQPTIPTFAAAANIVIDMRRSTWSNAKHAAQWTSSLSTYACPAIGNKMVPDITTAEILTVLSPVWITKSELANRVRERIATVLGWAIAQGYRTDNPAARSITTVLPQMPRTKQHYRALHYLDVPAALVMVKGPTAVAPTKLAKEWCIDRTQTIWAVGKRLSPTSWVLRQSRHTRGLIFWHSGKRLWMRGWGLQRRAPCYARLSAWVTRPVAGTGTRAPRSRRAVKRRGAAIRCGRYFDRQVVPQLKSRRTPDYPPAKFIRMTDQRGRPALYPTLVG